MSSRSWKFRIEDIIEALDRIFHYVKDLNYDGWMKDQKTIDAVYMKLETRYKKQEGEAPAAPILALNCWSL